MMLVRILFPIRLKHLIGFVNDLVTDTLHGQYIRLLRKVNEASAEPYPDAYSGTGSGGAKPARLVGDSSGGLAWSGPHAGC